MMRLRYLGAGLSIGLLVVIHNGSAAQSVRSGHCATITLANTDECVRLNEIQLLGTHNSYHIAPEPPVLAFLGARARDIEYTHRLLEEQLSRQGIRKFELDVFADPEGGRYAKPSVLKVIEGLDAVGSEL